MSIYLCNAPRYIAYFTFFFLQKRAEVNLFSKILSEKRLHLNNKQELGKTSVRFIAYEPIWDFNIFFFAILRQCEITSTYSVDYQENMTDLQME